jgi:hypothetical protein
VTIPGGSDVGTAYVRILADGGGFDDSIRRQVKDHHKPMEDLGDKDAEAYTDGFRTRRREGWKGDFKDTIEEMHRRRGAFVAEGQALGGGLGDKIKSSLRKALGDEHGDLTNRIFANLIDSFNKGETDLNGIFQRLENLQKLRHQAFQQTLADEQKGRAAEVKIETDRQAALGRAAQAQIQAGHQYQRDLDRRNELARRAEVEFERLLRKRAETLSNNDLRESDRVRKALVERARLVVEEVRKGNTRVADAFRTDITNMTRAAERGMLVRTGFFHRETRELNSFERKVHSLGNSIDRVGTAGGRLFGKGSRNNFFNAIGSLVEGALAGAGRGLLKVGSLAGELAGEFAHAARSGDTFGKKLLFIADTAIQNLVQAGSFLLTGLIGITAAIGALILIGGPLAALISALAAGVVGLAGSLAFALAGALGAVLPLILPLIAGIATLAIAFTGLNKAAKTALANEFRPIVDSFKRIRAEVQKGLFSEIGKDAKILGPVLDKQILPLLGKVAKAIAGVGTSFANVIASAPFQKFLTTMQTFLPDAIHRLGFIFSELFLGFAGLFRALAPFATRLLVIIGNLANKFANWANSATGQNRIAKFMNTAWQAAKQVLTTIKDLFLVFSDLLSAGNRASSSSGGFLDSINSSLERFHNTLNSPEGKKALAEWFSRAKEVFGGIGVLLNGIARLFSALNSEQGQAILLGLLKGLGGLFTVLAKAIPVVTKFATLLIHALGPAFSAVASVAQTVFGFFEKHQTLFKVLATSVLVLVGALKLLKFAVFVAGTNNLALAARLAFNPVTAIAAAVAGLGFVIASFTDRAGAAALAVFTNLKDRANSFRDALIETNGVINDNIRLSVGKQLQDSGLASKAAAAGITLRELTQGVTGNGEALGALITKWKALGDPSSATIATLESLFIAFHNGATAADQLSSSLAKVGQGFGLSADQITAAKNAAADLLDKLSEIALRTADAYLGSVQYSVGLDNLKRQLIDNKGAFQGNTTAALANRQAIVQQLRDTAAAALEQYKHTKSVTLFRSQLQKAQDDLRAVAKAAGIPESAINALIKQMHLTPKELLTTIRADTRGADASIARIGHALAQLNGTRATPTIGASISGALEGVRQVGRAIGGLVGKTIPLNVDTFNIGQQLGAFFNTHVFQVRTNIGAGFGLAAGAILNRATQIRPGIWAGEAGREAVVPMDRPLSQVDPSVRWLSAIAQGLDPGTSRFAKGGVLDNNRIGKQVNFGPGSIQVVTPTTDPFAVAKEVLNNIVAVGGY